MNDVDYYVVIEALDNAKKNLVQAGLSDNSLYDELHKCWCKVDRIEKAYNKAFSEQLKRRIKGEIKNG